MSVNESFDEYYSELVPNQSSRAVKLWYWLNNRAAPVFGWPVFLITMLIAWLPSRAADVNEWLVLGDYGGNMGFMGPGSVLLTWILLGWRRTRSPAAGRWARIFQVTAYLIVSLLVGTVLLTQLLVGWIPGPIRLFQVFFTGNYSSLVAVSSTELFNLIGRVTRWWAGVAAGGATQDDLVFAGIAGAAVWSVGLCTAWLVRRTRRGFLASLPSLWLLLQTLLYGSAGRTLMVTGLILAILLHILLDQHRLFERWRRDRIGYGDGLLIDRLVVISICTGIIMVVASLFPSIRLEGIASRYYQLYRPVNERVEGFGQRLFPDLKATSRFRGSTLAKGLPNSFLLGSGPELSQNVVMRVRTDDVMAFEPEILEDVPVTGHYMRGGTLSSYDGLGWQNPTPLEFLHVEANQMVSDLLATESLNIVDGEPILPRGRKLLTQDIFLAFGSRALYAASEPISFSVDYRIEQRSRGDQSSIWGDQGQVHRSYTVLSAIPAVNELALLEEEPMVIEAATEVDNDESSNWLTEHLMLPDTITDRTREQAERLTAGLNSPFEKAQAIETYLRTFEYDLSVPRPPSEIADVADYFMFELQRGYCDYYATAFVVLARLVGLPARFATGFAPGQWNASDGMWVITEAEAHSWPEVYFPSYGWIPFEPTAGRTQISRIGVGPEVEFSSQVQRAPVTESVSAPEADSGLSWQMGLWLIPVLALAWGARQLLSRLRYRQSDPWQAILQWGERVGRPLRNGETVLEYGQSLAQYVVEKHQFKNQDVGRTAAREIEAIANEISDSTYGLVQHRARAIGQIEQRWDLLRGYLRLLR